MRMNESPRAKSSETSTPASRGLAGGIAGVVATVEPNPGSTADTIAGGVSVASRAADLSTGASALDGAPVVALTAASVAGDTEPGAGLVFSGVAASRAAGSGAKDATGSGADAAESGNFASIGTDRASLDRCCETIGSGDLTSVPRSRVLDPPIIGSGASREKPTPKKTPMIMAATSPTETRYAGSELWGTLRGTDGRAGLSCDRAVSIGPGISRRALFAVTEPFRSDAGRPPLEILPSAFWSRNENMEASVSFRLPASA